MSAELVVPDDDVLCSDPVNPAAKTAPASNSEGNWWGWGRKNKAVVKEPTPVANPTPVFANKIVLSKRGKCMFEDKAVIAMNNGALGVIIHNYEVFTK